MNNYLFSQHFWIDAVAIDWSRIFGIGIKLIFPVPMS